MSVLVLLFAMNAAILGQSKPSLQGVWRVVETTTTGPTGTNNKSPQPGLLLITASHYAILRITSAQPRPTIKDPANPTPAEALASWSPFMAQAGTYEYSGNAFTTRAVVAKNPTTQPNGFTKYTVSLDGKTLTLVSAANASGPIANPTTIRLTRVE